MTRHIAHVTTATAALVGACFVAAPTNATAAAFVGDTTGAKLSVDYTVHDKTADVTLSIDGTQHSAVHLLTGDGVEAPGVRSVEAVLPDGTNVIGGDGAYVKCTTKGSSPLHFSTKGSHTFAEPGVYPLKVKLLYCGGPEGSAVAEKTVNIVIPKKDGTTPPPATWMKTSFLYSTKGRTLTYRYAESGVQHLVSDDSKLFDIKESGGYDIDFGDGHHDGANGFGGAECTTKDAAPFKDTAPWAKHTYARSGSYTVKVIGYYCGGKADAGKVTKTYQVTVGGVAPAPGTAGHPTTPTQPARPSTPAKPAPSTTSSASTGPKVNTDSQGRSDSGLNGSTGLYAAGALGAAAVAGGGVLVARRRR